MNCRKWTIGKYQDSKPRTGPKTYTLWCFVWKGKLVYNLHKPVVVLIMECHSIILNLIWHTSWACTVTAHYMLFQRCYRCTIFYAHHYGTTLYLHSDTGYLTARSKCYWDIIPWFLIHCLFYSLYFAPWRTRLIIDSICFAIFFF